jgi:hypothetical protein
MIERNEVLDACVLRPKSPIFKAKNGCYYNLQKRTFKSIQYKTKYSSTFIQQAIPRYYKDLCDFKP